MVCGRCAPKGSAFAKSFRFFYFNLYRRPAGAEGVRNPQQVELFAYIVVNGLYRAQFSAPRLLRNRGGAPLRGRHGALRRREVRRGGARRRR